MTRLALIGLTALLLAGCGRQGDLERPGPLIGRGAEIPAQPQAGPAAAVEADGDVVEGTTRTRVDPMDASRSMRPATQQPIEGGNDPIGDRPRTEQ